MKVADPAALEAQFWLELHVEVAVIKTVYSSPIDQ